MGQRLLRYALGFFIMAAILQAARTVEVIPEFLYDAPEQMGDMLRRMWPVDWSYFGQAVGSALLETLHMATLGTLLSLALARPLGLMVAGNVTPNRLLNFVARVLLVASRSVNSLVWALLFVAIFGPGPLAGMLAIALRSVGFVGKLVGEALEQAPRGPIDALQAPRALRKSGTATGRTSSPLSGRWRCCAGTSTCANRACSAWWAQAASAWR